MKKFLLCLFVTLSCTSLFAQRKPVVAVAPFDAISGITAADANVITRVFNIRLVNNNIVTVVDRSVVERVIREHQFQLEDWSNAQKTAELGEALNADWIVRGEIQRSGSYIYITVSFYNIKTFELEVGNAIRIANVDDAYDMMDPLVNGLVQTINSAGTRGTGGIEQPIPEGLLYEIVDGRTVTITMYVGNAATLNIPERIQGLPVTAIGNSAFHDRSSLTSVTIPSSVTSIGNNAFSYSNLTSITIPYSVTSIGDSAFSGCSSLTSITIPYSVTSIGDWAFYYCNSLASITVDSRNPAYASLEGILFDKNFRTIITYPTGRNQSVYVIPSSVTSIGNNAFSYSSLTSVTIPSSVTSIGYSAFFYSSLTSVTIPSSVTSIGSGAFSDCTSLISVTIPSSVTSIGNSAFSGCSSLTSITIPSSVTSIGGYAFYGCSNLTSVTLSRRTQVGEEAFPPSARITYRD